MERECKECGTVFDPKKKLRSGYINVCDKCTHSDVQRYLGRMDCGGKGKASTIEIFRTNLITVRAILRMESSRGFSPNLRMNSPASKYAGLDSDDIYEWKELHNKD